jgi:hypothetical protein
MKPTIAIIANSKYYKEYQIACDRRLKSLGWQAVACESIEQGKSYEVLLVVGMAFFPKVPYLKGKTVIGIQGEQLPLPNDNDWSLYRNLKRFKAMAYFYDLVIEWSPQNYEHHGSTVPRRFIPFGAPQPSLKTKSALWDVTFIGNPYGGKGRRIPILKEVDKICKLNPIREAWGDKKFEILNTSKICLNLHQFETHSFESPRIYELLSEGCFILTEPIDNAFPFRSGEHFIDFKGNKDLESKILYYLAHEEERVAIANAGKLQAQRYTQQQMIELLANEIQHAVSFRSNESIRFIRWLRGWWGNFKIAVIDKMAKAKRQMRS